MQSLEVFVCGDVRVREGDLEEEFAGVDGVQGDGRVGYLDAGRGCGSEEDEVSAAA